MNILLRGLPSSKMPEITQQKDEGDMDIDHSETINLKPRKVKLLKVIKDKEYKKDQASNSIITNNRQIDY